MTTKRAESRSYALEIKNVDVLYAESLRTREEAIERKSDNTTLGKDIPLTTPVCLIGRQPFRDLTNEKLWQDLNVADQPCSSVLIRSNRTDISRPNAVLVWDQEQRSYRIWDLSSNKGLVVNALPRLGGYLLRHNDIIGLGYEERMLLYKIVTGNEPELLTRAELEILLMLNEGESYEAIAKRRKTSVNTVKSAVNSIYSKLDARNVAQALYNARQRGLIK